MKRKIGRSVFYLLASFVTAAVIISRTTQPLPLSNILLTGPKEFSPTYLKDSTKVIALNKEAYSWRLKNAEKTIQKADSALEIAKLIGFNHGTAEAYRVKGLGYSYLNNVSLSTINFLKALEHFRRQKDFRNEARTLNNIGNLYNKDDFSRALVFFHHALKIAKKLDDPELLGGLHFNIANIYLKKSDYKKSIAYFDKSNEFFKVRKDTVYMTMYLHSSAMVYYHQNSISEAKTRIAKAIKLAKHFKLFTILADCYLTLAHINIQENKFRAAENSIRQGINYLQKNKNSKRYYYFIHAYFWLEQKQGHFKNALKYLHMAYRQDSLLLSRYQADNIDKTTQHYLQQQKINEAQLTISRQQYREATFRWLITLIILGFISFAFAVMILHLIKEKRAKEKEILIQNNITSLEQKALQAMMNPHFVFNIMNSIQYFVNQPDTGIANQILTEFSNLTRKHLEICLNNQISLEEEILYLEHYLSLEKVRVAAKMDYEIHIAKDVDTEDIYIPSLLIQPFVENAIWHGIMPKKKGGFIKLSVSIKNDTLLISILDNGVGIKNTKGIRKNGHVSRGMSMIWERVSLLNKLNKRHILINQYQTGDSGTQVLIQIPA